MALESFHRFGDLPPEVRCQIYLLATPPRAVRLKIRRVLYSELESDDAKLPAWLNGSAHSFRSPTPIPALLHTCTESRHELIRQGYELAFRSKMNGPRTWFNYNRDALCVPNPGTCLRRVNGSPAYMVLVDGIDFYHHMVMEDKERIRWIVEWHPWSIVWSLNTGAALDSGNPPLLLPSTYTNKHSWWDSAMKSVHWILDLPWRFLNLQQNTGADTDIEGNIPPFLPTDQVTWWDRAINCTSVRSVRVTI